jgi:hypothetical protein
MSEFYANLFGLPGRNTGRPAADCCIIACGSSGYAASAMRAYASVTELRDQKHRVRFRSRNGLTSICQSDLAKSLPMPHGQILAPPVRQIASGTATLLMAGKTKPKECTR